LAWLIITITNPLLHRVSNSLLYAVISVVLVFCAIEVLWAILRSLRRKAPYERGKPLLTAAERTFFEVLEKSVPQGAYIAPKVRIADVLRVSGVTGKAWGAAFGRIAQKHVDFAICDVETFEVLAVVELDDSSHDSVRGRKRDALVNGAFAAAQVPMLRVPWSQSYSVRVISRELDATLAEAG
jgi:uncharacterized protein DUF2726